MSEKRIINVSVIVDCYNCHSSEHEFYFRENGYDMVRCSGCGLLYIRERPSDEEISVGTALGEHHGEKNLHVDVYYNRNVIPLNRKILREIFKGDFSGIGCWLDIGCGHGEFIEALREVSGGQIEVAGSEPNLAKQKSARSRGLDVTYFDLSTHDRKFDMVSLLNVYSHLPDPRSFIGEVKNVIKPGGQFLIQTGDAADYSPADQLKPLCLPDHMSFVSEKLLKEMLEQHGFEIMAVHKFPVLQLRAVQLAKEFAKLFIPGKHSYLRYYLNYSKYADGNMYIRARLAI